MPLFSLIMCTLGDRRELDRFLASLERSTCTDYELIVVVQGSEDVIDAVGCKVKAWPGLADVIVKTSRKGLSRARNVGLAAARGRLVTFPDDDCWYPADFLARAAAEFDADQDLMFLSGKTVDAEGAPSSTTYAADRGPMRKTMVFRQAISTAIVMRRAGPCLALRFDEALGIGSGTPFGAGEETDFLLRGMELGGRGLFDPSLHVGHDQHQGTATQAYYQRRRAYALGYGLVLRRHRFPVMMVALNFTKTACGSIYYALRGDGAAAYAKLVWVRGTVEGYLTAARSPGVLHAAD
jgi:hypothetical protein